MQLCILNLFSALEVYLKNFESGLLTANLKAIDRSTFILSREMCFEINLSFR